MTPFKVVTVIVSENSRCRKQRMLTFAFYPSCFSKVAPFVIRKVISTMVIIRAKKKMRYTGMTEKPILFPISPKSGGINVEPTYALAICMPIMAPEFSATKL